jgi:hypothetical protein
MVHHFSASVRCGGPRRFPDGQASIRTQSGGVNVRAVQGGVVESGEERPGAAYWIIALCDSCGR